MDINDLIIVGMEQFLLRVPHQKSKQQFFLTLIQIRYVAHYHNDVSLNNSYNFQRLIDVHLRCSNNSKSLIRSEPPMISP